MFKIKLNCTNLKEVKTKEIGKQVMNLEKVFKVKYLKQVYYSYFLIEIYKNVILNYIP